MYLIGLTGNIATGKSAVGHLLGELGAVVIDADKVAHATMTPGSAVWQAIRQTFGPEVIAPDGTVDRRRLGEIVFRDPAALARLEAIVHPAVRRELEKRLQALRSQPQPPRVVVIEAIKLIEGGLAGLCDEIWLVVAPRGVQIERLVRTRRMSPGEAAMRIDAQPPAELKQARANLVIVNDGSFEDLRRQVQEAWARIPA